MNALVSILKYLAYRFTAGETVNLIFYTNFIHMCKIQIPFANAFHFFIPFINLDRSFYISVDHERTYFHLSFNSVLPSSIYYGIYVYRVLQSPLNKT